MIAPPKVPIAIISNSPTPYRTHLHLRIVNELPGIELWSVFTHHYSNAPWECAVPSSIRPLYFGPKERSDRQSDALNQFGEWRKAGRIIRWLREHRIKAVVLGGYNDCGRLRLIHWCRRASIPCFLFGDSNILGDTQGGVKAFLKRLLLPIVLRQTSGAMYCGRHGHSYFQKYGVPPARLFPFPYEPDYESLITPSMAKVDELRARYNLCPDRRYFLFCGRLAPEKRADLLISAFLKVAAVLPDWDLLLVGDGPLRSRLLSQIPDSLLSRVHHTGFINDGADLAALYACSDLFVLPSDYEPWGIVVTEAATRLALVCSDRVGAAGDLISEGINGLTFSSGNLESLVTALLRVASSDTIDRMKEASPGVLREWRLRSDPVIGLRNALASAGVTPH